VHVQVSEQVALLDQARELALLGGLDLARALAQLRRDEGQAHRPEDLFLGRAAEPAPLRSKTPYSESFNPIFTARMRSAMLCALLPVK
jgi:hypothetical protein